MHRALIRHYRQTAALIRRNTRLETGFSMLEAVVVVGVLLALAVGGFLSYGSITSNAKKAAVKSAASQVYTAAQASNIDGDPSTSFQDIFDDYNKSNTNVKVEPVGTAPTDGSDFCVQATDLGDTSITQTFGNCSDVPSGVGNGGNTGGTGGGSVDLVANPSNVIATPQLITYMNDYLAMEGHPLNLPVAQLEIQLDAVSWNDDALNAQYDEAWAAFTATDEYKKYSVERQDTTISIDYQNLITDPRVGAELTEYNRVSDIFWEQSATAETQKALIDAQKALYKAAIGLTQTTNYNFVAAPGHESDFANKTSVAGTSTTVDFVVAMPDGVTANTSIIASLYKMPVTYSSWAGTPTVTSFTENGKTYWKVSAAPNGGWVSGQSYRVTVQEQIPYGTFSDAYWKTFTVTVP